MVKYLKKSKKDGIIKNRIEKFGLLKSVKRVKVLPYHKYAKGKYLSLDMTDTLPDILPENTEIELATEIVKSYLQKNT